MRVPENLLQECEAEDCEQAATVIVEGRKLCLDSASTASLFARDLSVAYGGAVADRMRATQADANERLKARG